MKNLNKSIYLIGSLRNPEVPKLANQLREMGFDVFDDWFSAGKFADDCLRLYEKQRGHGFGDALKSYSAKHVFDFDFKHINRCDIGLMYMPAGKSCHLELGYMIGQKKPGYILFEGEPNDRIDVMYLFSTGVFFSKKDLFDELKSVNCKTGKK
jgi:nucleoside 2-deoxyribosyltransferase